VERGVQQRLWAGARPSRQPLRPPHRLSQGFLFRLLGALAREALKLVHPDSVFVDSPLSAAGLSQAAQLAAFLATPKGEADGLTRAEAEVHALARGGQGAPPSLLAASNLRRAVATAGIALSERIRRTGEPIHVLTALQEISPNVDALSLTPARAPPLLAQPQGLTFATGGNTGNKPARQRGNRRLAGFAEWCFSETGGVRSVVATGHSLWLRSFLNEYLPRGCLHEARKKKVANCAVLAFTLQRGVVEGVPMYRVPPESLVLLYGGYTK